MNKITHAILHCSDSEFGSAKIIRSWHLERGFKDIAYHFVILNGRVMAKTDFPPLNGSIELGRDLDGDAFIEDNEIGAHTLGYNGTSIGICLIGVKTFTIEQFEALKALLMDLCRRFSIPAENVLGHCETESGKKEGKTCPNFYVGAIRAWLKGRLLT